jgi:hypothetical protein
MSWEFLWRRQVLKDSSILPGYITVTLEMESGVNMRLTIYWFCMAMSLWIQILMR